MIYYLNLINNLFLIVRNFIFYRNKEIKRFIKYDLFNIKY